MTDIYQSPGDRLRFEILLKSLTEGSINLAVMSDHDRVLDYYGHLFEERLRAKGESHVEFCSSTNSEKLVQKFNEILSEISLDQALEKDKKHAPRRILVFRDSILMQDFELQLLARLVNGFPAGNISVILLINSAGNYKGKLDAFGKNILQWEVETEAGEPKKKLEDWVATEPEPTPEPEVRQEPPVLSDEAIPVSKLLNIPTKTAWRVPGFGKKTEPVQEAPPLPTFVPPPVEPPARPAAPAPVMAPTPAPTAPTVSAAARPIDPMSASSDDAPDDVFKRPARRSYAGWILLVILLSGAAFAGMYKDLVMDEVEQFKKYLLRGTAATPLPSEAAAAASAAAQAASAASAEALAAAELAAADAQLTTPAASAASAATDGERVASPASAVASVVAAQAPAAVEETNTAKKEADSKADAKTERLSDDAWVKQLPPEGYVLQLSAMDTEEELRKFQRSNEIYAKARIMRARNVKTGKRYFILVAGPFANKSQADAYMQSSPLLTKGWLRTSQSMKTQFNKS